MLGIKNRSENWRVSNAFIENKNFANLLASRILSNYKDFNHSQNVEFELFWTGYRDYYDGACKSNSGNQKKSNQPDECSKHSLACYEKKFGELLEKLKSYNKLHTPKLEIDTKKNNYIINDSSRDKFLANLYHTEIDIVINVGGYLLIGEAKSELSFGAKSAHVLVHQLIRQYVMASILVDKLQFELQVVPFILSEKSAENTAQVKAMLHLGWLNPAHIFKWSDFGL